MRAGWTVGRGLAFTPSWSTRIELPLQRFRAPLEHVDRCASGLCFPARSQFHTVRLGVSYRFGGGLAAGY
jgi:outer membrane immunogenic protein